MHPMVKNYIYGTDKQREDLLINAGLYEKVYAPENESENYSVYPYKDKNNNKRYKKVAIEVTDEEFLIIKKKFEEKQNKDNDKFKDDYSNIDNDNKTANAIGLVGIIIIVVGFILGIVMSIQAENFFTTIIFWCISAITGISFLGFAEIISLLDALVHKK